MLLLKASQLADVTKASQLADVTKASQLADVTKASQLADVTKATPSQLLVSDPPPTSLPGACNNC